LGVVVDKKIIRMIKKQTRTKLSALGL
jgi:hypothetical protein